MFKSLYKYWYNINDTPSILFKLNIWTYINIRFFKFKFSRNILYFIQTLNGLKLKNITYLHRDWIFEDFFFRFLKYFIFLALLLLFV